MRANTPSHPLPWRSVVKRRSAKAVSKVMRLSSWVSSVVVGYSSYADHIWASGTKEPGPDKQNHRTVTAVRTYIDRQTIEICKDLLD